MSAARVVLADSPLAFDIGDAEFDRFQRLIEREAGIHLSREKKSLLLARLSRRLRELGLTSFAAYYRAVMADASGQELVHLLDRISTNETSFFREPAQFDYLRSVRLPRLRQEMAAAGRKRVRVWSAGCSTGEEPYSLAMVLLDFFPAQDGWEVEILATDLSSRVLREAESGLWRMERVASLSKALLRRYMLRGVGPQEGMVKARRELREVIRFRRLNLNGDAYPDGPFDLVLCRNVLIYFQTATKARIIEQLIERLGAGGLLLVGHSETLTGVSARVRAVVPTIYAASAPAKP